MPASDLWFVVPGDPEQNTGGYRYVRRLVEALRKAGVNARVEGLAGRFPRPDSTAESAMEAFLTALPDGARVVLDGLAMGALPFVLQRHRQRLQLMALVHHPLADETGLDETEQDEFRQAETLALEQVGRVFTTSPFTTARLEQVYKVPACRLVTAQPAVDDGFFAIDRANSAEVGLHGLRLLCVGHLSARKAQHQLLEALQRLEDLPWQCTLVGAGDRAPDYAAEVKQAIKDGGLASRIELPGELEEQDLAIAYGDADLFVFPSLYEGYGMVIDEALATGLPVLASDGGALAHTALKPGARTYPVGDVSGLARRLRSLLSNTDELGKLADEARTSRQDIRRWSDTARDFLEGLEPGEQQDPARFTGQWLQAREPADHAARSEALTHTLAQWLAGRYHEVSARLGSGLPLQIVDIGTGRGSNPVYLVPRFPVPQQWVLVEPDQGLLQAAVSRVEALDAPTVSLCAELTAENLDTVLPEADLMTASALIDLVSEPWLTAFVSAVSQRRSAVLVVLSYSGQFELSPPHPSDARVQDLVNRHQHGDKGRGSALGPDATAVLRQKLQAAGYQVQLENSPWRLGEDSDDAELISLLMWGWVQAACEQNPRATGEIEGWLEDRRAQLAVQQLRVAVSHLDLLALPGPEGDR